MLHLTLSGPFRSYVHAGSYPSDFKLRLYDCIAGMEHAVRNCWFQYITFDQKFYDHHEWIENGDFNWIIPGKMLAFGNPSTNSKDYYGYFSHVPEDFVPIFKRWGITAVVRLNDVTYDAQRFVRNGIRHYDLYFPDGSCPSPEIIRRFLQIANQENALAIHCTAGLGRTGTLIGIYAIEYH